MKINSVYKQMGGKAEEKKQGTMLAQQQLHTLS